jgi:hypothetical protein
MLLRRLCQSFSTHHPHDEHTLACTSRRRASAAANPSDRLSQRLVAHLDTREVRQALHAFPYRNRLAFRHFGGDTPPAMSRAVIFVASQQVVALFAATLRQRGHVHRLHLCPGFALDLCNMVFDALSHFAKQWRDLEPPFLMRLDGTWSAKRPNTKAEECSGMCL